MEKMKMTFMGKWLDDIENDPNFELTEEEKAYITYAAVKFGLTGEKINIGEVFGKEFNGLNMAMSNIYGQIDNIQSYNPNRKTIYDENAIYELRLKGFTAVQICEELGYDVAKAKSLTSNKGWVRASKERKAGVFNF